MFNVGGGEVLVILLIALIVLGPDKLPNAARQAGKYLGDFRRMSNGFKNELKDAMDLGDLGDLMSGNTKPQSAGGPTARPASTAAATVNPSTDASPIDLMGTAGDEPSANGSTTATTNGNTVTPNGSSVGSSTDGDAPAVVRKRSIEVDGPSSSFD
jgi:sec-independent protein translocase protein TatB